MKAAIQMLICCALLSGAVSGLEIEKPRVLVLHSYHHGFTWSDNISQGIRNAFEYHRDEVELRFEFMDTRRIHSEDYFRSFKEMLSVKYRDVDLGAIICCDDHALNFMISLGRDVFPEVPVVFCSVSGYVPSMRSDRELTGLEESIEIKATLDVALRLHPRTEEVVVITDTTRTGQALKTKAARIFGDYLDRVRFRYIGDQTIDGLQQEVASLSEGALVFLFIFNRDKAGRVFSHEQNLKILARQCKVPIYAVWEFYLGHGIVGGKLTSGEEEGRLAGELALRILNGERASVIPLRTSPTEYMFDHRQLARFGIDAASLPEGSRIIERPSSFYEQYKSYLFMVTFVIVFLLLTVTVLAANILRRRKAEEGLRLLNEELEARVALRTEQLTAANKELEAFAHSVSHDLRAPLRSMDGFSQALLEDYHEQLDGQGRDYLNRVREASQRMGHLINDILRLSRASLGEFCSDEVDLGAMAEQIVSDLEDAESGRRVKLTVESGLLVNGDANLLEVTMVNLLSNAWKFTTGRKEASIEFGALDPDQAEAAGHPGEAVYFVRDNGAGFDMTYSDRLFGPFQRLHSAEEFPGTGIGLATAQRIITRHGGLIWADGKVDGGATFFFTLGQPEAVPHPV